MQAARGPGEDGTDLFGAERDHEINPGWIDLAGRLRPMPGDVDADLGHGVDGMGIDFRWLRARAHDLDIRAKDLPGKAFRHLATRRVCDAKKKDLGHAHHFILTLAGLF
ncbi:hypothetical protein MPC4_60069 [Methylocella tundrae]|uniref:Uncharacterized protein n=1 Tax=Methylocella tundrae TaxID=227605 RepID=A0A8B6MAI6_METTU|nr:hypothetical protein MPC4_60069 [Methylocella tundrae]